MGEIYKDFPVRDQDTDIRQTLDLLQGWGLPGRGIVRGLFRRGAAFVSNWLQRR
jgi:hypothetical protein